MGILGDVLGFIGSKNNTEAQIENQRAFAQNGIQWKVKDAEKAGIHPLYALGAQTPSFQPVSDNSADFLASAGQSAEDLFKRTATTEGKQSATMTALAVERAGLENELLRSQIRQTNAPHVPPTISSMTGPIPGQGNALVQPQPSEPITGTPGRPSQIPGAGTDYQWSNTSSGGYAPTPSPDIYNTIEDSPMMWQWFMRNGLVPPDPPTPPPKGMRWQWSPITGEYVPVDARGFWERTFQKGGK